MRDMKKDLFYAFLIVWILTAIVTLAGVVKIVSIEKDILWTLVTACLIETAAALVAIFKKTDFYEPKESFSPSSRSIDGQLSAQVEKKDHLNFQPSKSNEAIAGPFPGDTLDEVSNNLRKFSTYCSEHEQSRPLIEGPQEFEKSILGIKVNWRMELISIDKVEKDEATLFCCENPRNRAWLHIDKILVSEHPSVKFLKKGQEIIVCGKISKCERFGKDVTLSQIESIRGVK